MVSSSYLLFELFKKFRIRLEISRLQQTTVGTLSSRALGRISILKICVFNLNIAWQQALQLPTCHRRQVSSWFLLTFLACRRPPADGFTTRREREKKKRAAEE
jgi:hypothetical protein